MVLRLRKLRLGCGSFVRPEARKFNQPLTISRFPGNATNVFFRAIQKIQTVALKPYCHSTCTNRGPRIVWVLQGTDYEFADRMVMSLMHSTTSLLGFLLKYVEITPPIFEAAPGFFGFDLTNTAEKRWTATSEAETSKLLRLGNFAFKDIISPDVGGPGHAELSTVKQITVGLAVARYRRLLHACVLVAAGKTWGFFDWQFPPAFVYISFKVCRLLRCLDQTPLAVPLFLCLPTSRASWESPFSSHEVRSTHVQQGGVR